MGDVTVNPPSQIDVDAGPVRDANIAVADKGLKANAIGYASNLAIGIASTAPAYSLAATLGFIAAVRGVGVHTPAVLVASFVPMLFVAVAYRQLNKVDPDCGTAFAWVTRALGPRLGWMNGWVIFIADVLVMASLASIAARYSFSLVGWSAGASSTPALIAGATAWITLMTWISYRGVEISARTQQLLLTAEVLILGAFAVAALIKVYGSHPHGSLTPQIGWMNPFALNGQVLVDGVLLGAFLYWGWDAALSVNEESEDAARNPGRAAVVSTLLLVLIFVVVSVAGQAYAGPGYLSGHSTDVLSALGTRVFGSPWDKLLLLAVISSTAASTQTTIMPTARTTLSMANWGAIPERFGRMHPRFKTPTWSTVGMGIISAAWTAGLLLLNPADNVLGDSITALGMAICFYYGFTAISCPIYFRDRLRDGVREFVFLGVVPLAGGLILFAILYKAVRDYSRAGANYAAPLLGIQAPIAIAAGALLVGVILMLALTPSSRAFFARRPERSAQR